VSKVLEGVRILEISGIGPGPFCGMVLADLGADVICIERPVKGTPRPRPSEITQRGKRSVILDLKAPDSVEVVLSLLAKSDALIEGMRPGVMERLGLGPDICLNRNPRLIYGRLTGWGQTGPLAHAAGHDSNYTALAGALWFAGAPETPQLAPSTVLGDVGGGALYMTIGILAGIVQARSTGAGQVVDTAIVDGTAHMLNLLLSMTAQLGGTFDRGVHIYDAAHWAGRTYACSDGGLINIAPLEPKFYALFVETMGLSCDARFVDGQMNSKLWPELTQILTDKFAEKPRAYWIDLLEGTDCCFAPVLTPAQSAKHPHMAERGVYESVDGILQARAAPRFSNSPLATPNTVPVRGQHTAKVMREFGINPNKYN